MISHFRTHLLCFLWLFLLFLHTNGISQTRFFQVKFHRLTSVSDWRDTAFVVATQDVALLAQVEAQLALPVNERMLHINGTLAHGSDGYNRNGPYFFSWHLSSWLLAELSMEVCDGRPYIDVEQDTAYWINSVGQYCSWPGYIAQEVTTTSTAPPHSRAAAAWVYPQSASHLLHIYHPWPGFATARVWAVATGETMYTGSLLSGQQLNVYNWPAGLYILQLRHANGVHHLRLLKS